MNRFKKPLWRNKPDGMFIARGISDTEHCVICKVDTHVPKTLDIDNRLFYITGVGQFCHDCYDNTGD
jgi:hypothetical protein